MILTTLPDLPPRPETSADAAFRRSFYSRWARENAIVCGSAIEAEYASFTQALSIKTAWGGSERYFLRHREVAVDADNFLVLNEGSRYGSLLAARRPAFTFSVFFRPGMHEEVLAARRQSADSALALPDAARCAFEFSEHLRPHDPVLAARLQHLRRRVQAGERDENWLEEQLLRLLDSMLTLEAGAAGAIDRINAARVSTRRELARRLRWAADFIQSSHAEPLTLAAMAAMAAVACLSRYHFVRLFGQLFGTTPHAFLTHKRARAAQRLIASGETDREPVAQACGFANRWALQRALRRHASAA